MPATSENIDLKEDLTSEYVSHHGIMETPYRTNQNDDLYGQLKGVTHSACIGDKSHECETTLGIRDVT